MLRNILSLPFSPRHQDTRGVPIHGRGASQDKKAKWLSEEALQIAMKRREVKSKGEKERYTHLNAEFQRSGCGFVQVSCQGFLVREACVRVLVGGAVSVQ